MVVLHRRATHRDTVPYLGEYGCTKLIRLDRG